MGQSFRGPTEAIPPSEPVLGESSPRFQLLLRPNAGLRYPISLYPNLNETVRLSPRDLTPLQECWGVSALSRFGRAEPRRTPSGLILIQVVTGCVVHPDGRLFPMKPVGSIRSKSCSRNFATSASSPTWTRARPRPPSASSTSAAPSTRSATSMTATPPPTSTRSKGRRASPSTPPPSRSSGARTRSPSSTRPATSISRPRSSARLRVLDGAVGVFCAVGGVEVQSRDRLVPGQQAQGAAHRLRQQARPHGRRLLRLHRADEGRSCSVMPAICTIPVGQSRRVRGRHRPDPT